MNVLGAAAGALLAPWVLLPLSRHARAPCWLGALGEPAWPRLGALLWRAGAPRRRAARRRPRDACPESADAAAGREPAALGLWIALYALSGFVALSLEIVWFRLLDVAVKSHGLHVRHRARALPARARRWAAWPARRSRARSRRPLRGVPADCQCAAARARRRCRSSLVVALPPATRRSTTGSSTTGRTTAFFHARRTTRTATTHR